MKLDYKFYLNRRKTHLMRSGFIFLLVGPYFYYRIYESSQIIAFAVILLFFLIAILPVHLKEMKILKEIRLEGSQFHIDYLNVFKPSKVLILINVVQASLKINQDTLEAKSTIYSTLKLSDENSKMISSLRPLDAINAYLFIMKNSNQEIPKSLNFIINRSLRILEANKD